MCWLAWEEEAEAEWKAYLHSLPSGKMTVVNPLRVTAATANDPQITSIAKSWTSALRNLFASWIFRGGTKIDSGEEKNSSINSRVDGPFSS